MKHTRETLTVLARHALRCALVIAFAAALVATPARGADKQRTFATPEEAITDLVAAVKADDKKALMAILGPEGEPLVYSGDSVADRTAGENFVQSYDQAHTVVKSDDGNSVSLETGADGWPFPIPVVKDGSVWRFDTQAGRQEILNRRIGRNEISAIETCRAYVDAQREYYAGDPDGDSLLQYAQKLGSSAGKRDGLYWETKDGEPPSPFGPLIISARGEGYRREGGGKPTPYRGYYYKILTAQGAAAPGGAYSYLAHDKMIGGFGLVAYPAEWDNSGVMTFIVNQDGVVYQKDLGPKTTTLAPAIAKYDPDSTWARVGDGGDGDEEVVAPK